jgi:3-deoxy-manno-octulosonate cytidylyltransferase (CMP-KDO synthetase)
MEIVAVIPARMASTRFPGKPLFELAAKPMLQWVYEAACRSEIPAAVVVATPDQEIADAASAFGAEVILTHDRHPSGTDRIAEVAQTINADAYVNVQGDEPLLPPEAVDACCKLLLEGAAMASLYNWAEESEFEDPSVVKVVTDLRDRALYFSRSRIPYERSKGHTRVKKHVGIYGYTKKVLSQFASWDPSPLEKTEMLEQLRFLEHGVEIRMALGSGSKIAVDTPEQAATASRLLQKEFSR